MKISVAVNLLLTTLLTANYAFGQPLNDGCGNATPLCPNQTVSGSNQGATATLCPNCEDDFTFCFSGTHSVWFTFTTNTTGGDVSIDFSALNFVVQAGRGNQLQAVIVQAAVPCNASTFTVAGNCEPAATGNFSLVALALPANTTYYVVVNGAANGGATLPAEASFDIAATGTGITRIPAGLSIGGPSSPACPEQPSTFTAYLANCTDTSSFTWKINGEIVAVTTSQYWQTSGIEDGDIVTLECSCFADCPEALTAQFGPIAVEDLQVDAGADQIIASGESTTLSGTTNGISWYWTPDWSLADPLALQTVAIPPSTTTYFLTATSASGCTLADETVVTVGGQFIIPGSFTPNGDGVNDFWIISGIDNYPNANVRIYSRWGQEIANLVGYSSVKNWDGTKNGTAVTDGTYFYTIDLRNEAAAEPMKGYVMVIR